MVLLRPTRRVCFAVFWGRCCSFSGAHGQSEAEAVLGTPTESERRRVAESEGHAATTAPNTCCRHAARGRVCLVEILAALASIAV